MNQLNSLNSFKKKKGGEDSVEPTQADISSKICHLCGREQPLFFYGNEEQINRLPESVLTPILSKMKADLAKSKKKYLPGAYLKYMNCTSKFIHPCECGKEVHAYCMTASVVQQRKIYCPHCKQHYKLFLKKEQVILQKLFSAFLKYFLMLCIAILACTTLLIVDGYLKCNFADQNPKQADINKDFNEE